MRHQDQFAEFRLGPVQVVPAVPVRLEELHLLVQLFHAAGDLHQPAHDRLQTLRSHAQLFEQCGRLPLADDDFPPDRLALGLGEAAIEVEVEIVRRLLHQVLDRRQVMRHPAKNLLLADILGFRGSQRALERQFSGDDLFQNLQGLGHREVTFHHPATVPLAAHLDLLGEINLAVAGEEGDVAHLAEIHPHRIARRQHARGRFVERRRVVIDRRGGGTDLHFRTQVGRRVDLGPHDIDQFEFSVLECDNQIVDHLRAAALIGQVGVHIVKREMALLLSLLQQTLQRLFEGMHSPLPFFRYKTKRTSLYGRCSDDPRSACGMTRRTTRPPSVTPVRNVLPGQSCPLPPMLRVLNTSL